mmetsp:Transcript_21163/g.68271  ORF Transcript_21163/g.68271 Transcript_21163/m.68271 type:complete len:234 (+) Transcript_21163:1386-2087(+)
MLPRGSCPTPGGRSSVTGSGRWPAERGGGVRGGPAPCRPGEPLDSSNSSSTSFSSSSSSSTSTPPAPLPPAAATTAPAGGTPTVTGWRNSTDAIDSAVCPHSGAPMTTLRSCACCSSVSAVGFSHAARSSAACMGSAGHATNARAACRPAGTWRAPALAAAVGGAVAASWLISTCTCAAPPATSRGRHTDSFRKAPGKWVSASQRSARAANAITAALATSGGAEPNRAPSSEC